MLVVNCSQRLITFPISKGENISFTPGIMVDVSKSDWDDINKRPYAKKLLDEGIFVTGTKAKTITANTKKEIAQEEKQEKAQLDEDDIDVKDIKYENE